MAWLAGCSISRAGTGTDRVGPDGELIPVDACATCGFDGAPPADTPGMDAPGIDSPLPPPDTGPPPDAGCFAAGGACAPGATMLDFGPCGACNEGTRMRTLTCSDSCAW